MRMLQHLSRKGCLRHLNQRWKSTATHKAPASFTSATGFAAQSNKPGISVGILRESYDVWERRTPMCPKHVEDLLRHKTVSQVLVQPSPQRCFSNADYERAGAVISEDLQDADVLLGVKRPAKPNDLLADKTYMFFSHVIKGQPGNMALLQTILDRRVQLIDYECIVDEQQLLQPDGTSKKVHIRTVAFGKYAGLAGMIDTFYPLGRRLVTDMNIHTPFLHCPPASMQRDLNHAKINIENIGQQIATDGLPKEMGPLVFCLTGKGGKVYSGAKEIFDLLPSEVVAADDLPELLNQEKNQDYHKVYLVEPTLEDLYQLKNGGGAFDIDHWKENPADYDSRFANHIAPYIHALTNCIYWDPRYARLLSKDDVERLHQNGQDRLAVVADISCDINGSIEFMERPCSIARPYFHYDPLQRRIVADEIVPDRGITVMGVDILPAELPKESSGHFGDAVVKVLGDAIHEDVYDPASGVHTMDLFHACPRLSNACITTGKGHLTPRFHYLESFLDSVPKDAMAAKDEEKMEIMLHGHLFDSGFINAVLDIAEHAECGFNILNARIDRAGDTRDTEKSSAILRISSKSGAKLDTVEEKIHALVDVMARAEATVKRLDKKGHAKKESHFGTSATVESERQQNVLVLGAGRVSMSLVDLLGRTPQKMIKVASDNEAEAREVAKIAQRGAHVGLDLGNDPSALKKLIKESDMVISLLPAPLHPRVAEECIAQKTNLVTASYESPEMKKLHDRAKEAGIIIINEVGLDPGLDHMSAMKIIDDVRERGGTIKSFKSVCGGLPSPEAANNPLKYKFSWSPKGVITASQNAARYRWNKEIVEIEGPELMKGVMPFNDAWPEMELELLPNRDSLKYENIYGIHDVDTLFRGTLRFAGFSSLMYVFKNMGMFQTIPGGATWADALETLRKKQGGAAKLEEFVTACAGGDQELAARAIHAVQWLEMNENTKLANKDSIIDSFCAVLEEHLQFGEEERDMVAMYTAIEATFEDGKRELHQSSMKAFGDETMSAMCKTVGMPAAAAADLVMRGDLKGHAGLVLPIEKQVYVPILAAVQNEGIVFDESVSNM